jgi:hypothetical protein
MGGLLRAAMAVALVAALAGACANAADTTLHPDPPAVTYAPLEHPFRGARLFVDDQTTGARWQRRHGAGWLDPITTRPQARWLNGPADLAGFPALAARAHRQRALLVLVAYYLPNRGCSPSGQGAPTSRHYRRWVDRLIDHLGSTRAAIVVEPDAVAADCFDTRRAILLKRSVKRLADAGQYVYLDAGHARWRSTGEMAQRLLRAGIQYAQGFSVNVANRQTTKQSYRWGTGAFRSPRPARVRHRHLPQRPRPSPGRPGSGRRMVQPTTPGARAGPHLENDLAWAGRAALGQAPRRVRRHLRRRDQLSLLPDPGSAADLEQPYGAGGGTPAGRGRPRLADHGRQYQR